MTDCDILKFNAFNAWIAAGNMTKLVVARGQQARMIGNKNEVVKQLTIRHIKCWEQDCFEPIYSELESHMPKYIAMALSESTSPSDLHGQLLVASSKLLADCLKNNCLTYPTFASIQSWFSTILLLKDQHLFELLPDKHLQLLLDCAEECASIEHKIYAGMSNFALFCPLLLMVVLAHVVNTKFSKIPEMKQQHMEWSVACGISLSDYLFPEIHENDGDIFFSCKFSCDEVQKLNSDCSKPIQVLTFSSHVSKRFIHALKAPMESSLKQNSYKFKFSIPNVDCCLKHLSIYLSYQINKSKSCIMHGSVLKMEKDTLEKIILKH